MADSTDKSSVAFQIRPNTNQITDDCLAARLVEFPGFQSTRGLMGAEDMDIPDQVQFESIFDFVKENDYLLNDVGWPLMSPRMLEVLLSVGEFNHRAIPVRLFDDTALKKKGRFDDEGNPPPGVVDDRFVGVQLREHLGGFDYDKSDYMPGLSPKFASKVSKLVINVPPEGLPPLFRLEACARYLFVSAQAKSALDEARIKGAIYHPLDQLRT